MIGRYGGCFEEDIIRLMSNSPYHVTGFGCTGESCTDPRGENGLCTVPKRLANYEKGEIAYVHGFTLVINNSYTYCKVLLVLS